MTGREKVRRIVGPWLAGYPLAVCVECRRHTYVRRPNPDRSNPGPLCPRCDPEWPHAPRDRAEALPPRPPVTWCRSCAVVPARLGRDLCPECERL